MPRSLFKACSWKAVGILPVASAIRAGLIWGCGGKAVRPVLPQAEQYSLAKKYYDKKKYRQAAEEFQKLIFNYPGATVVDTALYYLGESYFHQEDYPSAAGEAGKLPLRVDFIHRVEFGEVSGHRVLIKRGP